MTIRAVPALAGRVALVTGAGSGLGRVIALHLGRAGCRVILVGRNRQKLEAVNAELVNEGIPSRIALADVSDASSVERLKDDLGDEDLSILVNNAGVGGPVAPIEEISPEEWDLVFQANVRSLYLMCRAFLPRMYKNGDGDVVNIASVTGKRQLIRRTPYASSKLAVIGFTRTLAFEAGPKGVRVNSMSPGPVRGDRMKKNFRLEALASGVTEEEAEHAFVSRSALGRLVEEEEIGAALIGMLQIPALCGADIDVSAGMIAPA